MRRVRLQFGGFVAIASQVMAQTPAGDYSLSGKDDNGESYSGQLRIVVDGPVFRLTFTDGKIERGMGIQRGNLLFTSGGRAIVARLAHCCFRKMAIYADLGAISITAGWARR
jgi:hypothetical protein